MPLPAGAPPLFPPAFCTETRRYVGFDGFAGFRAGRLYSLRYYRQDDGEIAIALDHQPANSPAVRLVLVTPKRFKTWWQAPPTPGAAPAQKALLVLRRLFSRRQLAVSGAVVR